MGTSNVRQINNVLAAMERMRSCSQILLKRAGAPSKHNATRSQRSRTTSKRRSPWYAPTLNLLQRSCRALRSLGPAIDWRIALFPDVAAGCADAAQGCKQVDRYVQLLIEASCGKAAEGARQRIDAASLAKHLEREVPSRSHGPRGWSCASYATTPSGARAFR